MKIKLMSFNIQHGRNYNFPDEDIIDLSLMANVIEAEGADIVGLNEVRGEGPHPGYTDQAKEIAEKLGYHYFFAPAIHIEGHGPYGNALISKYPIVSGEIVPIPDPADRINGRGFETRCILKAVIDVAGTQLTVLVTHFGLNPSEAENAAITVVKELANTYAPKVLMGDFNLEPDSPVLDRIRILMADTADMFKEQKLSFPSDNPSRKIDYILVSDDITVIEADIPDIVASDHRPHTAVIEI
jgi:endonuclease/exonuclease/phosphatase family metal-dependent hydrolase